MGYMDTISEILLIVTLLIFIIGINKTSVFDSPYRTFLTIALLSIIITASFGAVRFAGVEQLAEVHDDLSLISARFAMVVYAFCLPLVFLASRKMEGNIDVDETWNVKVCQIAKVSMVVLLVINLIALMLDLSFARFVSDVGVFLGFILFSLVCKEKPTIYAAIIVLLLVPATGKLHLGNDLSNALYHLLLASHFWLINRVFLCRKKSMHFAEMN